MSEQEEEELRSTSKKVSIRNSGISKSSKRTNKLELGELFADGMSAEFKVPEERQPDKDLNLSR